MDEAGGVIGAIGGAAGVANPAPRRLGDSRPCPPAACGGGAGPTPRLGRRA
jgi:hypothetical protein